MAKKKSYEQLVGELEQTVNSLDENELPLEEAIKSYQKGIKLYTRLSKILDDSQEKIKIINDGEEENFND